MSERPYTVIESGAALERAVAEISNHPVLGVDCETAGGDPFRSRVRLLQIATPEQTFVMDLFRVGALTHPQLRRIMTAPEKIKVFHNAKFDLKMFLRHFNLEVRGVGDTMLAGQLLDTGLNVSHSLAATADRNLGIILDKTLQASDWGHQLSEEQYVYAATDAAVIIPLWDELAPKLQALGMAGVADLEFNCVLPVAAMELAGMPIDADRWRALVAGLERAHDVLSSELRRELAAGIPQLTLFGEPEINLDSPAQITEALGKMGIVVEGTRSWQLQPLAKQHAAIAKLLEYRTVKKALTSYGLALLDHIHPVTGRLHADFRQIGATGGRMSCSDPNLQQIPNTPDYRVCFHVSEGRKLITADYSQIELRILADWSQDAALVKSLMSGEDLHRVTASRMFGVPLDQVSKEDRAAAKQLNYGIIYGLGPQGLAARLECSIERADDLIRKYFALYRDASEWLREAADRAVTDRENRTRSGRLIRFEFDHTDRSQVAAVARVGKNAPIQGSSADIIKRALTRLYDPLKPFDAKVINCVHDEIVVEVDEANAQACAAVVEREMIEAAREFIRSVPVSVEIAVGDAWMK
jgi:DNA polymerase-1